MTLKLENWQKYALLPIAFAIYILMSFNVFASDLNLVTCPAGSTLAIYQHGSIHTDDTLITGLDCGVQDTSIFCQNRNDCSLFNGVYDIYVLSAINGQDWILSNQTIASSYENFNLTSNSFPFENPNLPNCSNPIFYSEDNLNGAIYCNYTSEIVDIDNTQTYRLLTGSVYGTEDNFLTTEFSYDLENPVDICTHGDCPYLFNLDGSPLESSIDWSSSTLMSYNGFFSGFLGNTYNLLIVFLPYILGLFAITLAIIYGKKVFMMFIDWSYEHSSFSKIDNEFKEKYGNNWAQSSSLRKEYDERVSFKNW